MGGFVLSHDLQLALALAVESRVHFAMIVCGQLRGLRVIITLLSNLHAEKKGAVDPEKTVAKEKGGLWRNWGAGIQVLRVGGYRHDHVFSDTMFRVRGPQCCRYGPCLVSAPLACRRWEIYGLGQG